MLSFIRKHSGSVFVKVFLGLIAFTFLFFFGMSDVIRKYTGKDYVIKIGDVKIGPNLLKYECNKRSERLKKLGVSDENSMLGVVINQIIDEQLTNQMAKISGISVSEKLIKNYIRSIPDFVNTKTGQFNKIAVRNFMASMHMPEETFIDFIRRNIEQTILLAPISYVSIMPALPAYIASNLEKRTIKYTIISENIFSFDENIDDQDLISFFNKNKNKFMEPETRDFSVLIIHENNILKTIEISDENIKKEYNESGETENLEIVHDKIKNILKLRELETKLENLKRNIEDDLVAGISIDEIGKKYNLSIVPFKKVTNNKAENIENYKKINLPFINEIMTVAFQLEANQDSSFAEGLDNNKEKIHWIVHNDMIEPTHVSDYDVVKNKVIKEYKKSKINEKLLGIAKSIIDKINDGNIIDSIVGNLKIETLTDLSRKEKLDSKTKQWINQDILNKIFELQNLKAEYAKIKDGYVIFQITSINDEKNISKDDINKYGKQLSHEISADLYHQFKAYFAKKLEIKINKDMLKNSNDIPDIDF